MVCCLRWLACSHCLSPFEQKVRVCVDRRVTGPMLCLVPRRGTAGEEQFTCTEVRLAGSHKPLLTRAKLVPGFSSHAYQSYHSRGLVAAGWTLPATSMMKTTRVLPLSCAVLRSEKILWVPLKSFECCLLKWIVEGPRIPTLGHNLGGAGTESRRY